MAEEVFFSNNSKNKQTNQNKKKRLKNKKSKQTNKNLKPVLQSDHLAKIPRLQGNVSGRKVKRLQSNQDEEKILRLFALSEHNN